MAKILAHQPRKRFGQNFLHDKSVISQIIDSIHANRDDLMLEIGPANASIIAIETITAIIINTTLSTKPTAVRIESREKTMSTKIIWIITVVINPEAFAVDFGL